MISNNESTCPKCGGELKYYDSVKRIVRTKYGRKTKVNIRRFRCKQCGSMHRELPDFIFPYKQYEADIIIGVIEGLITCETLGFEDYPWWSEVDPWITDALYLHPGFKEYFNNRTLQNSPVDEFTLSERGRVRPITSYKTKDRIVRHDYN